MSIFDLIPTIPEVVSSGYCITFGHEWVRTESGKVICAECGKVKKD